MSAPPKKHPINPPTLVKPIGFAHGWLVVDDTGSRRTLYLAGQCGYDREGRIVAVGDLVGQLDKAMANIGEVLSASGLAFPDLVQLNFYVTSRDDYTTARKAFGDVWRRYCSSHYPAMAMFMVAGLFDPQAVIEIQGIAAR
ncbi:MAG: RidA family protein [Planctomycetota bacterium]